MTDIYGQVRPCTIAEDAPRIRALLEQGPVRFKLTDGEATLIRVTIGPRMSSIQRYAGEQSGAGYRISWDTGGSSGRAYSASGYLHPSYAWEKWFQAEGRGWWYMCCAFSVVVSAIFDPEEDLDKLQKVADSWLQAILENDDISMKWNPEDDHDYTDQGQP